MREEQLGVKFRRQHPIGPWVVDFYSWEAGLVVEVDGDSHFTPQAREYDAARTESLEALGLRVVRITNDDVFRRREAVLLHILEAAQEAVPSEDHYRQWRRGATLKTGDVVFFGRDLQAAEITAVESLEAWEEVYDLEVEGVHSFLTEVCAVHDCSVPARTPENPQRGGSRFQRQRR
ncbi:MAG: DUF559 domain-containing protein [Anaerolineae bacterium]|nr:DUF559 domain-containing protein [Anaerolineae bacterium]